MHLSPDQVVLWRWGPIALRATIAYTWVVMAVLAVGGWLITRRLSPEEGLPRWQNLLEVLIIGMQEQIRGIAGRETARYLPFVGTLFLFIGTANILAVVPGFEPPTGSLSTTVALALCVFIAVPLYGIRERGVGGFLGHYIRPTVLMLPFNIIGELSRTVALAVRLYGNIMSGTLIVGILISVTPFFFPVVMELLGLLTGLIQAYIFAVLAMIYIASATSPEDGPARDPGRATGDRAGGASTP